MSCEILGREKVEYTLNITNNVNNTYSAIQPNTTHWTIQDSLLDLSDNTTTITNANYLDHQFKIYESKGNKSIEVITDFDDGWNQVYQHKTTLQVEAKVYIPPVLSFDWTPLNPTITDNITVTQSHDDIRDMELPKKFGRIDKIQIDYYNNNVYEVDFISDVDITQYNFPVKQDEIEIRLNAVYWDGYQHQNTELIKTLEMANIPPISKWDREDGGTCVPSYTWTATSTDLDDDEALLTYQWKLYQNDNSNYTLIDSGYSSSYSYPFQYEGFYRIELTTFDQQGASHTKTEDFELTFVTCDSGSGGTESSEYIKTLEMKIRCLENEDRLESYIIV